MKLVTYRSKASARPGAVLGSGAILDLRHALADGDDTPYTIAELLAQGPAALRHAADVAAEVDADGSAAIERGWVVTADEAQLLAPTGHNPGLWSVGPLYPDHLREMGVPAGARPPLSSTLRTANAIIGSGEPIILPATAPDMVDWEGEFALVVGSPMYQVDPSSAMNHIAGYTLYHDVSARDHAQGFIDELRQPGGPSARSAGLNLLYKEFPTFSPLGPCIVTTDEVDLDVVVLRTTVNGETVQEFRVADTLAPIAEAVANASRVTRLMPGDVLSLGTSEGVGFGRQPQRYLRPGDEVAITVDGIGSLRNPVSAAPST